MSTMRRILVTVVMALAWLAATPAPASAHSVSGVRATNYLSRLKVVRPDVPGLDIRVIETGSRFELENRTDEEVVVLGYQDEPYLRVGPRGVFENRRSPATYLNADRDGGTPVPGSADPKAPPEWQQVSDGSVARWHDHRIHWMGEQDPPAVRRDRDTRHVVIPEWKVVMKQGDRTIEATGDLVWIPGPSPVPWLALAGIAFAATALLALSPSWGIALAAVMAILIVGDVTHAVGVGFAKAGGLGTRVAQVAAGSFYSVIAWIAGGVAVWTLARRRPDGLFAAAFAGVLIAVFGGVVDLGDLSRSQVPFAWSANLARLLVAVSVGAGFGLATAAVLGRRRLSDRAE